MAAAYLVDQQEQPSFKHFCKICKKGFMCGRALGGHMRAHGIGDENGHLDDEDPASDWDNGGNKSPPNSNKRSMYALRTNPNRLKSCRVCENCGKEFSSWKSFLEHGKCSSSGGVESLVSSPCSDDDDEDDGTRKGYGWSKGKRTRRVQVDNNNNNNNVNANCSFSEEEDLAHCLVMLSNAQVDPLVVEAEESCASASKEERRNSVCIVPPIASRFPSNDKAKGVARGIFECKACKKVFTSHQALGGHRASHKKVKGCFAARQDDIDESVMDEDVITNDEYTFMSKTAATTTPSDNPPPQLTLGFSYKRKSKVHECTICHRIFSSGQALGGHKRCHWLTSSSADASAVVKFPHFQDQAPHLHQKPTLNNFEPLDLNLPASFNERQEQRKLLSLDVPTDNIYLQPWIGVQSKDHHNKNADNINGVASLASVVDDEADSKLKLAKLSDLKDVSTGGGSSPWLQVGIGSSSNVGGDP